jgi:hypothetical protein
VKAYAQDHFFDVITNAIGLIAAILASKLYWWIDPAGAIVVSSFLTFCFTLHTLYRFGLFYPLSVLHGFSALAIEESRLIFIPIGHCILSISSVHLLDKKLAVIYLVIII